MWMGKSLLHFGWQFRNSPQSKSSDWRGDRVRYLPNEASCWKWFDWEWCWEGRGGQHRWFWARFGVISGQQRGKASPQEVQVEFFLFFDNFVNLISREFLVNLCNTGSFWASNGAKAWFQSQVDFFYIRIPSVTLSLSMMYQEWQPKKFKICQMIWQRAMCEW